MQASRSGRPALQADLLIWGWVYTPMWMDSAQDLSGDAVWYAALCEASASSEYGRIAGLVQS